jgi:hypothetical protein
MNGLVMGIMVQYAPMTSKPASGAIRSLATAFFIGFLVIGLSVYRDYGISWDEVDTREFGIMNVDGRVPDLRTLDSLRAAKGPAYERFGPLFEILIVRAERLVTPANARSMFYLRHLLTFLTYFVGVVLFYLLCRRRFSPGIALVVTCCLAASPVLFSHAFYNTKDISFLTAFVATMLTLDRLLHTPSWRALVLHALTTVLLLGVRILGMFGVLITAAAVIARRPTRRTALHLLAYTGIVTVLLPVVWPVLRVDPVGIVKGAVVGTVSNMYSGWNLFRGRLIPGDSLPWDYVPTWMVVTTPLVLTALFVLGLGAAAVSIVRHPRDAASGDRQRDLIVLVWFLAPVTGTMVLRPIMYDAWRHLFFVYPAFIYLAGIGMETVVTVVDQRIPDARRPLAHGVVTALLFLCLAPAVGFMITNHPYEHLYFNRLAGRDMAQVKQRFELDYWGLSYREALEHIVRTDTSRMIKLEVLNYPGVVNLMMLDPADQARLRYTRAGEYADYFVTNYRLHPQEYRYPWVREVFSVRVGNASIATVFRLLPRP